MKRFTLPLLTLSVLLYSASAFAQHGHVGGSMGPLSVWMGRAASAQSRGVAQPRKQRSSWRKCGARFPLRMVAEFNAGACKPL